MKKIISLILSAALVLSLAACGRSAASGTDTADNSTGLTDDALYVLKAPEGETPPDGGGKTAIAFACDYAGISTGANMAAWRGVQVFANTFHYTATSFSAKESTIEASIDALRQASESGARIVVCNGDLMAASLYKLQGNYPAVNYLLLDGEPHDETYATYTTASNVHCALFAEEQAGYLAGYMAVQDGSRALGFVGSKQLPGIVRYATGFLQGIEAAAEDSGLEIAFHVWFCATDVGNDQITEKIRSWYADGTNLIMVSGGDLVHSAIAAADDQNGRIITTDYDQSILGDRVKMAAVKCYSRATQQLLYRFFQAGGSWSTSDAGTTEVMDLTDSAVALATGDWRLHTATQAEYTALYEELQKNVLKVGRYSDMNTLPDTPNVAVYRDN